MSNLPKTYNPKEVEDAIYQKWEASGFFDPDKLPAKRKEPFSIAMPPPNVTGELHVGHATYTIQDLMIRHARMSGKKTLWLPGTDHGAIATNYVVEREIWEKEKKARHDLGREEFLRRVNEFVEKTKGRIQIQLRKMGFSCDWSREKYTLSEELSLAVRTVFKKMYDAGLIYRGDRIVNWCPRCGTTLADDEVEYKETRGNLYHIKYPLAKSKGSLTIATARPETMLGDTAVAVHPDDKRYQKYVGQTVMLPLVNRELEIIADPHVDREFGTGVLKVTPGHDPHDSEIGERHKLEIINIFTLDGKINGEEALNHGFEKYAGLPIADARKRIVQDLEENGFLEKTEDITHSVGVCYRCGTAVEPIVSKQWFVNVNAEFRIENSEFRKKLNLKDKASLKEIGTAAVKSGAIKIVPERFTKIYLGWMENLRDWNISRQIWFGHQIPVWYKGDEIYVGVEAPKEQGWTQDADTLDTWFSSSLWTFSTLGWPEKTEDLKTFHPTTILETGYDILFFWVARMVLMTGFALSDIPFKTVYLHGLVRDRHGKKMSKSAGNAINPLAMQTQYGTDALRLALIINTTPGNDIRLYPEKIAGFRNFANKLWNIARYILQNSPNLKSEILNLKSQSLADQWILAELDNLTATVNQHLANYQYGLAGEELEKFTWDKFADWYIEIAKFQAKSEKQKDNTSNLLTYVLTNLLKLWHPFIPFVTEHIWSYLSDELLMIQKYPLPPAFARATAGRQSLPTGGARLRNGQGGKGEGEKFKKLQELITGLRNLRAEYREEAKRILAAYLELPKELEWIAEQTPIIEKLARVKMNFEKVDEAKKMPYFIFENTKAYLIIPNFNPKKERELAEKELKEVEARVKALDKQLTKKEFLKKAPAEVVEKIKTDYQSMKLTVTHLQAKLKLLK